MFGRRQWRVTAKRRTVDPGWGNAEDSWPMAIACLAITVLDERQFVSADW
jgi:hypothetical protein